MMRVMSPIEDVARELAAAHRAADPDTKTIKLVAAPQGDEIRLLEISDAAPTTDEVLPFRFGADRANGIGYPSVVVLLSPADWSAVRSGRLPLPAGWDLASARDL